MEWLVTGTDSAILPPPVAEKCAANKASGAPSQRVFLPLREDLQLHSSFPFADGAPAWTIQDPVSNRFFRIGWLEYECLLRWHLPPESIAKDISAHTALEVVEAQVNAFAQFLEKNHLLRASAEQIEQLQKRSGEKKWMSA
ncbi:MAG: hypothetical protein KBT18_09560 [Comamonas sp.]|nr:hypothetical protein [Candidatus Comamonas equi]